MDSIVHFTLQHVAQLLAERRRLLTAAMPNPKVRLLIATIQDVVNELWIYEDFAGRGSLLHSCREEFPNRQRGGGL